MRHQDVRPRRRAEPRAARAVHAGGRRRVRRAVRRPSPGLQPADRRRHRLRGLRLAVGRRLRHRLRQQGRPHRPDARPTSTLLGGVEALMREITSRISFGMGVPAQERVDHPVLEKIRDGRLRAAAQARAAGRVAARHGRLGQPLRQSDGGRGRPCLGRRPLRLARLRPQDGVGLPGAGPGPARSASGRTRARWTRRPCCSRSARSSATRTSPRWSWPASTRYAGRDVVVDKVLEILGARRGARGAQPPQLRVARGAPGPHVLGDPEGLHARPARPGGLRRRLDGRRVGDPGGCRVGRERAGALLDRARRRPGDEPDAGGRPRAAAEAVRMS